MKAYRDLVEDFYKAIIKSDMDLYKSVIHQDYEVSVACREGVLSGTYKRETILELVFPLVVGRLNTDNFTFCKNYKIICEDDMSLVTICEAEGTAKGGERYNQIYAHFFSFKDWKICKLIEFQDTALANKALWPDVDFLHPDMPFSY